MVNAGSECHHHHWRSTTSRGRARAARARSEVDPIHRPHRRFDAPTRACARAVRPSRCSVREHELTEDVARDDVERARGERASSDGRTSDVRLIVTDVDGTLLDSRQRLSATVAKAIEDAANLGVMTVLATGKTRGPWAREVYERIKVGANARAPGLFVQGLVLCDSDGNVLSSQTLEKGRAKEILRFARARGCAAVAFCVDRIACSKRNEVTDRVLDYGEPPPVECGDLIAASDGLEINKILLFGEEEAMGRFRAEAAVVLAEACDVTTAVPGMLEFLPKGASKGSAVRDLCEKMGIDAANVLALGDGENDAEMLAFAGVGVAVGNASAAAKAVADVVLEETNDQDAVAVAVEKYVLRPRARALEASTKTSAAPLTLAESNAALKAKSIIDAAQARALGATASEGKTTSAPFPSAPASLEPIKANATLPDAEAKAKAEAEIMAHQTRVKAEMEEKMILLLRKIVKGAQSVSESVVGDANNSASVDDDEFEQSVNRAFGDKNVAESAADDDVNDLQSFDEDEINAEKERQLQAMERAARESKELLERQRANKERLKKLNEELEAAKAALAQSRSAPAPPANDAANKQRAKEEMIVARTSLKKAIAKAEDDAKVAKAAVKEVEAKDAAAKLPSIGLFGFMASAFKTVTALTSPEGIERQREAERATAKANVLSRVVYCDGGRDCTPDTFERIQKQIKELEAKNPTRKPAASALMLGRWSCAFTNSTQILGTDQFIKQNGPVFFSFDIETQRCEIQRSWPALVERATMTTRDGAKIDLSIEQSKVLGIPLPSRNNERDYSSLEVTYLDFDLAVCRGRDETVYVFIQNDPNFRLSADGTLKALKLSR